MQAGDVRPTCLATGAGIEMRKIEEKIQRIAEDNRLFDLISASGTPKEILPFLRQ
jgi:hypothetical protein